MNINTHFLHNNILTHTLLQEIQRLKAQCNPKNINYLEQQLALLTKDITYLVYEYVPSNTSRIKNLNKHRTINTIKEKNMKSCSTKRKITILKGTPYSNKIMPLSIN